MCFHIVFHMIFQMFLPQRPISVLTTHTHLLLCLVATTTYMYLYSSPCTSINSTLVFYSIHVHRHIYIYRMFSCLSLSLSPSTFTLCFLSPCPTTSQHHHDNLLYIRQTPCPSSRLSTLFFLPHHHHHHHPHAAHLSIYLLHFQFTKTRPRLRPSHTPGDHFLSTLPVETFPSLSSQNFSNSI